LRISCKDIYFSEFATLLLKKYCFSLTFNNFINKQIILQFFDIISKLKYSKFEKEWLIDYFQEKINNDSMIKIEKMMPFASW
jgi:hypothetical protein